MTVRSQTVSPYRIAATYEPRLAVHEPSPAEWDAFVDRHPRGHLLQSVAWGVLKRAFGWQVGRVAVVGPPVNPARLTPQTGVPPLTILAGAQVLVRRRYGLAMGYVPRGPLFAGDGVIDDLLLTALDRIVRRRWGVFLRIEPNLLETHSEADSLHTWLLLRGFRPTESIQPRSTIHVDLTPEPAKLLASFRKGHRADIRRAEREGVTVRSGGEADLAVFQQIMESTGQRADFGVHNTDYYRTAWEQFGTRSRLLLAEHDGAVVAAHLVFVDALCGYYLYSGATATGLKSGANHLLQWEALQWARAQGCTAYDLWGIPDALGRVAALADTPDVDTERAKLEAEAQEDPLNGVYRFKKGFAGQVVRYLPAYDRVYLPTLYDLWQRWRRA